MTDISNALKIDGWMQAGELIWLAEQAERSACIVEVGSWMGRSTRALVDNTSGVVYAVDTWIGSDEPAHKTLLAGKPLSPNSEKPGDNWLMDQFRKNFPDHYFEFPHKLRCLQETSVSGAKYLGMHYGKHFDMIFLDASHTYEAVKQDILAWKPFLNEGGLMCGHDYGASFPGVKQAVDEIYGISKKPNGWRVGQGTLWAIK